MCNVYKNCPQFEKEKQLGTISQDFSELSLLLLYIYILFV